MSVMTEGVLFAFGVAAIAFILVTVVVFSVTWLRDLGSDIRRIADCLQCIADEKPEDASKRSGGK